ncbi:MAG: hypothetical protein CVV18_05720 [Gammaproteobacteria bacterium HGW-Gammaproteobacteria-8]|nr:MAG: hypothetical protein CVV18_05720 [Gammaproteobacteria bacterium HGW-Gammaproteobacteria-8]
MQIFRFAPVAAALSSFLPSQTGAFVQDEGGIRLRATGHSAEDLLSGNTLASADVYRALYFRLFGKRIQALPVPR